MKNNWLVIASDGEIETGALTLLGASTKRSDSSKIGFFGSGLKYTLALLLRKNIPFCIWTGEREMIVTKENTTFRDQEFDRILIDGEQTSFTTSMGVDWEPWMAIRELYSNALDEPNCTLTHSVDRPTGSPQRTTIGIYLNEELYDFCEIPGEYFADFRDPDDLLFVHSDGKKLYRGGHNRIIYRKGIRAQIKTGTTSIFHYDFPKADLTETRTLKYEWHVNSRDVPDAITRLTDVSLIQTVLDLINNSLEAEAEWNCKSYTEQWIDAIDGRVIIPEESQHFLSEFLSKPHVILPATMVNGLKSMPWSDKLKFAGFGKGDYQYLPVEKLSSREEMILEAAHLFMADAGMDVTYPVKVVNFMDKKLLGRAIVGRRYKNDEWIGEGESHILISRLALERGVKETVCTLIEEQSHLDTHLSDETRGFQDYLVLKLVNVMEMVTKRVL